MTSSTGASHETRPFGDPQDDERGARAGGARDLDVRYVDLGAFGEQRRVRLGLDVLAAGEVQLGATVLVGQPAPRLRQQLRVGFVAAEDAHLQFGVALLGEHDRAVGGLVRPQGDGIDGHAELLECGLYLAGRGPSAW